MQINLVLEEKEVLVILTVLGEAPFKVVDGLIRKIRLQINKQATQEEK